MNFIQVGIKLNDKDYIKYNIHSLSILNYFSNVMQAPNSRFKMKKKNSCTFAFFIIDCDFANLIFTKNSDVLKQNRNVKKYLMIDGAVYNPHLLKILNAHTNHFYYNIYISNLRNLIQNNIVMFLAEK